MADERPVGLRERKRIETWHAIHDAAMALFRERGYEAVNVDDIAAAANVSRSTFFNYFATKDSVIRDPPPGAREAWQYLFDRPVDEDLWDSLVAILTGFAEHNVGRLTGELDLSSPSVAVVVLDRQHPIYADLKSFVDSRTEAGRELEAALYLNVALAAAETAFAMWPHLGSFAQFLENALTCLNRVGSGLALKAS